jgi:hypothetical protein
MGVQRGIFDGRENRWKKDSGFHEGDEALWRPDIATYCFKTEPVMYPFGAGNVTNGIARPEGWPNIWISDPSKKLPQELVLRFAEEKTFSSIHLKFNTGLNRTWPRDESITDCVKSYRILTRQKGRWRTIVDERDNVCRFRRHQFSPVRSREIKLRVLETHGAPSAQVFEIRAY